MKESSKIKAVKAKPGNDTSTEDKIKNAARVVFHKKGFAATRTRDIAEEAGINLALLNYYFRSKQKLFDIIMLESIQGFAKSMLDIFNNDETSLEIKLEMFADKHIELLIQNPDIPLFILSELRANPGTLLSKIGGIEMILKSRFIQQLRQSIKEGKITPVNPLHLIMNLLGMTAFPFIASPLLKGIGHLSDKDFNHLMLERKKLIPRWIKAALKAK
jgi:AcrR family transcriptional regulator